MIRAALILLAGCAAAQTSGYTAQYVGETTRYPHGALGDPVEYGALRVSGPEGTAEVTLPERKVFEDTGPRLVVLPDGRRIVAAVQSDAEQGASLVVYRFDGRLLTRLAETPPIGQRNRWLAVAGIADLDGDGSVEIAYVETPHLGRTLIVWRLAGDTLVEVGRLAGITNHAFGDPKIRGGLRECGAGPEVIAASAGWSRAIAVTLKGGTLSRRDLGPIASPDELDGYLRC